MNSFLEAWVFFGFSVGGGGAWVFFLVFFFFEGGGLCGEFLGFDGRSFWRRSGFGGGWQQGRCVEGFFFEFFFVGVVVAFLVVTFGKRFGLEGVSVFLGVGFFFGGGLGGVFFLTLFFF